MLVEDKIAAFFEHDGEYGDVMDLLSEASDEILRLRSSGAILEAAQRTLAHWKDRDCGTAWYADLLHAVRSVTR